MELDISGVFYVYSRTILNNVESLIQFSTENFTTICSYSSLIVCQACLILFSVKFTFVHQT